MNHHLKTSSPDLILTQFSSQTVHSITSHVKRKRGNVNFIQERQTLTSQQGLIQYKDGVHFTTFRIHGVVIPPIDQPITHIPFQTDRFAARLYNIFVT
jgi:hypothetical protein